VVFVQSWYATQIRKGERMLPPHAGSGRVAATGDSGSVDLSLIPLAKNNFLMLERRLLTSFSFPCSDVASEWPDELGV